MPTTTIKYSQPTNSVMGDPITVPVNLAKFKAQEKAIMETIGSYKSKYKEPSKTAGMIFDWFLDVEMSDPMDSSVDSTTPVVTAVSGAGSVAGGGDPSDYLKTSLPQATKQLLKFIISSWKGGFDMNAYNQAMQLHSQLTAILGQLAPLLPTALPDGIPACSTGHTLYTQIAEVILQTYLKMPATLTTDEVKAANQQMQQIASLNEDFSSKIGQVVLCFWMKIPPMLKLPIAYTNSTIIVQALTKLLQDWLSGSSPSNIDEVDKLLDTIQG